MSIQPLLFRQAAAVTAPAHDAPPAQDVISGDPRFTSRNHYTDSTGRCISGEWSCSPGAWKISYAPHEEEFCVLLEGEVRLTASDGQAYLLRAGDAFIIPGGFEGVWETIKAVRKYYVIATMKE